MLKTIEETLRELERAYDVKILYAAESGSRAWGFASPDSDYDVRFIYVHRRDWYLRLSRDSDVIELPVTPVLDVNGWDVQKMLRLLYASNPTLFEWCSSPVVYRTTDCFEAMRPVIAAYFQAKPGLYHYLGMAKKNYREYLKGEVVRGKKYFYVLRPILACRWILEHDCPPPMLFEELAQDQLPEELTPAVRALLDWKRSAPEVGEIPRIGQLNRFIESELALLKERIDRIDREEAPDWEPLNRLFLKALEL